MKKYWARLGSPDAISLITVVVVFLIQTSGSFITALVDYTGRIPDFLLVRLCATLSLALVLMVGKVVLRSRFPESVKPWSTIFFIYAATVAAVVADDTLLQVTHFTSESRLVNRLALSLVGLPIAMIVTGLVVTALRDYSRMNHALLDAARELLATRTEASERIAQRRSEMTTRIQEEIGRELSKLDSTSPSTTPQAMKALLDDVVRPLSHQLERDNPHEDVSSGQLPRGRVRWSEVFVATVSTNPFHPIAAAAWPTATTTTFLTANFGPQGLVAGLIFFAMYSSSTWVFRRAWSRVSNKTPTTVKAVLVVAMFAIVTWLATAMLKLLGYGALFTGGREVAWIFVCEMFSWTIALLFTANTLLQQTTVELSRTVDELQREVIALRASFRRLQRRISRVLHGPVQQALAASIYELQSADGDTVAGPDTLTILRQRIAAVLETIAEESEVTPILSDSFAELIELWSNVSDIHFSVTDDDLDRIQRDEQAAHAVNELVREACLNAMKHGSARHIDVALSVEVEARYIAIDVRNDGNPLMAQPARGLGSQLFDEMCLRWVRGQDGDVVVTELVLPITV